MPRAIAIVSLAVLAVLAAQPEHARADEPSSRPTPDQLLAAARERRGQAEAALARFRAERLDDRAALAQRINELYERLGASQRRADRAAAELAERRERAASLEERAVVRPHRIRALLTASADRAGVEPLLDATAATIETQLGEAIDRRLRALAEADRIVVERSPVVGRDGKTRRVDVLRLGAGATLACGPDDATVGLTRERPGGRLVVGGPPFDRTMRQMLRHATTPAASAGEPRRALVPLDVSGTLAERPPSRRPTFIERIVAGGLFIYPILAIGALGLALIAERLVYLSLTRTPAALGERVVAHLAAGRSADARAAVAGRRSPSARVLRAGVDAIGLDEAEREAAMESALLAEAPRLERSLALIAACAAVAPLLGLLGTVSGIMTTFQTIAVVGTGNPRLMSGGISEALVTTQWGLVIAIPLLIAHAGLRRWVQRREAVLEYLAVRAFGIGRREEPSHG